MEFNTLVEYRKNLERRLAQLICDEVRAFKKDTGITPDAIAVDIIDTTTLASPRRESIIAAVRVSITV